MTETDVARAFDVLTDSEAATALRERHRDFYLEFAERAEPELRGPDQAAWLDLVEVEHGNLRAALDWSITRADGDPALRMVGALERFWVVRGYGREAVRRAGEALEAGAGSPPLLRARALLVGSRDPDRSAARTMCERALEAAREAADPATTARALESLAHDVHRTEGPAAARPLAEEALELARQSGRRDVEAWCLGRLSRFVWASEGPDAARAMREDALALARGLGDRWTVALELWGLMSWGNAGHGPAARAMSEECLAIAVELGDDHLHAWALHGRGGTEFTRGNLAAARRLFEEAVALLRARGDSARHVADFTQPLGWMALYRRDAATMRTCFDEIAAIAREHRLPALTAHALDGLAFAAFLQGDHDAARSLEEQALAAARESGEPGVVGHKLYERTLLAVWRGDLDEAQAFADEWLAFDREAGKRRSVWSSCAIAEVALRRGDRGAARLLLEEALDLVKRDGHPHPGDLAHPLTRLGELARGEGELKRSEALHREAMTAATEADLPYLVAESLESFAKIAVARSDLDRAARLLGAADAIRERIELAVRPGPDSVDHDEHVALVRAGLGEDAFARAWAEGRAMGMDAAVAHAMS